MLPPERTDLSGCTQSEPGQDGIPFESTLGDDSYLFRPLRVDFGLVLRRPVETAQLIGGPGNVAETQARSSVHSVVASSRQCALGDRNTNLYFGTLDWFRRNRERTLY
jgi:hypothetical protein